MRKWKILEGDIQLDKGFGIVRVLSPVTAAEIQAVEKERKAKNILLMAIPKEHMRRFHGMDDAKEIWEAIRTRSSIRKQERVRYGEKNKAVGFDKMKLGMLHCHIQWVTLLGNVHAKGTHDGKKKRDSLYQHQEAGKQEKNQMGLLIMDDGIVNWEELY
ncbi:hypothetical protein Tco_0743291 [Tanacetum coccineum]